MTEHNGLPVAGYRKQSEKNVELVNKAKEIEERALRHLDELRSGGSDFDQRMVSLAVTGIQEAFMWANRAVFQPDRVKLPEDK